MATTLQNFLNSLLANGGIVPSVENFKAYNHYGFTDKGKRVEQCTEQNDFHAGACCPRMLSAAVSRIPENIPIRTSGNRPTEGDDNTILGC